MYHRMSLNLQVLKVFIESAHQSGIFGGPASSQKWRRASLRFYQRSAPTHNYAVRLINMTTAWQEREGQTD